jgi:hypothetical protein
MGHDIHEKEVDEIEIDGGISAGLMMGSRVRRCPVPDW